MLELDASASEVGLDVQTQDSIVTGLAIHGPHDPTGRDAAAIRLNGSSNLVAGNHIGVDVAGGAATSVDRGVEVRGSANVIGGDAPEDATSSRAIE